MMEASPPRIRDVETAEPAPRSAPEERPELERIATTAERPPLPAVRAEQEPTRPGERVPAANDRASVAVIEPERQPMPPAAEQGAGPFVDDPRRPSCTVPQLRRFIKSRTWVPMHELRRRFGINGVEDDVTPIRVGDQRLYVGLPDPEARLMAELLSGGDVGYELSLDPGAPIVVGVYPMRPVPRG